MIAGDFEEQSKMVERCCNAAKIQVLKYILLESCNEHQITISQVLGTIHSHIEVLEGKDGIT